MLTEHARDRREDDVSGEVTVAVVDGAEQVEVGDQQGSRATETGTALECLLKELREVPRVEELRLRIEARLCLELGKRERAMDEDERSERDDREPRVRDPESGDDDTEEGEHEIRRDALEREEPGCLQGVPSSETEDEGEKDVVDGEEGGRGSNARHELLHVIARQQWEVIGGEKVEHPLGREPGERVVRDVECLDVPGVPDSEPLRDVEGDGHEREERRGEEEGGRNDEDGSGVVRLVAGRVDHEELSDRRRGSQEDRESPVGRVELRGGTELRRVGADSESEDRREVDPCSGAQVAPLRLRCHRLAHVSWPIGRPARSSSCPSFPPPGPSSGAP